MAKPGTKIVIVDETEELAKRYESVPVTGRFFRHRPEPVSAPVDRVPPEMRDVEVRNVCDGELYCLSFRKAG